MIETNQSNLEIKAGSHPGMSGKQNEDRYRVCSCRLSEKNRKQSTLAVLCDGIGGHKAGEIAAQIGVSIITETLLESRGEKPLEDIEKAVKRASEAVYQTSLSDQGRSGMGATAAIAWIIGNRLYTANLGDSRIYLFREGHVIQLTTDHTWVQEAYEAGLINEKERQNHPNAHVIRRYLGIKNPPKPDFRMWFFEGESDSEAVQNQGMPLKAGDVLLLCSDGLTDLVKDSEIQSIIENNTIEIAVDKLIELANARGGHDNITVILMKIPSRGDFIKPKRRRFLLGCLSLLIALGVLITLVSFGWHWWQDRLQNIEFESPGVTDVIPTKIEDFQIIETPPPEPTVSPTSEEPTQIPTQRPSITPWPTNTSSP